MAAAVVAVVGGVSCSVLVGGGRLWCVELASVVVAVTGEFASVFVR